MSVTNNIIIIYLNKFEKFIKLKIVQNFYMEFINGDRYFYKINDKIKQYNYLNKNLSCDILIIGGGINGAIINYYLSKYYNVALVEKSRLGGNLTSLATALLEYQLDDFASDLKPTLNENEILNCYNLGLKSIEELDSLISLYGNNCHYKKRPTLIFSKKEKDKKLLEQEYLFRKKHGYNSIFLTKENNFFNFDFNYGIYCENGGAELDPYLFTKMMIENSQNQNDIFENTEIVDIQKCSNGYICVCKYGEIINCKEVIVATGFNFNFINSNICTRFISFSIVTNPLPEISIKNNTLIQDCLSPYHYLRKLPDERIILGGEDEKIKDTIDEKKSQKKYEKLLNFLKELFPEFKDKIKIEYKFCGAFGSTENNMGLIGRNDDGLIHFISCGANGILNAISGVKTIENLLKNKFDGYSNIFTPLRK